MFALDRFIDFVSEEVKHMCIMYTYSLVDLMYSIHALYRICVLDMYSITVYRISSNRRLRPRLNAGGSMDAGLY